MRGILPTVNGELRHFCRRSLTPWKAVERIGRMDFPSTRWSSVAAATLHGDPAGREALENLCRRYYQPVRSFIAWRRGGSGECDDLTQEFFLYFMEQGLTHRADRERGKFRTFLLSVLRRFLSHHDRAAAAEKRGAAFDHVELDNEEPAPSGDEISQFDREWARALMHAAIARAAAEIEEARGIAALEVLRLFFGGSGQQPTYEEAAARLGISVTAAKQDVLRWRRRLGDIIRLEVCRTVSAPHEVREEMAYLQQALLD
jgi:RNA polymerase sigma-70 factor (ECF subfamily)